MMEHEFEYCLGGACKTIGNGIIGQYLVKYGSPSETDNSSFRDYFTAKTYFDLPGCDYKSRVLYEHGLSRNIGTQRIGNSVLGLDSEGVTIEAKLERGKRDVDAVLAMVNDGLMAWSSGTVKHLIRRKEHYYGGRKVHEVLSWPLGLDASLTVIPADPRLKAAMKRGDVTEEEILQSYLQKTFYFGTSNIRNGGTDNRTLGGESMEHFDGMKKNQWSVATLHRELGRRGFVVIDVWSHGMAYSGERAQLMGVMRKLGIDVVALRTDTPAAFALNLQNGGTVTFKNGEELGRIVGPHSLAETFSRISGVADGSSYRWLDGVVMPGNPAGTTASINQSGIGAALKSLEDPRLPFEVKEMWDKLMGANCAIGYWYCGDPERPAVWIGLCDKEPCWSCCGGGKGKVVSNAQEKVQADKWLEAQRVQLMQKAVSMARAKGIALSPNVLMNAAVTGKPQNRTLLSAAKGIDGGSQTGPVGQGKETIQHDHWRCITCVGGRCKQWVCDDPGPLGCGNPNPNFQCIDTPKDYRISPATGNSVGMGTVQQAAGFSGGNRLLSGARKNIEDERSVGKPDWVCLNCEVVWGDDEDGICTHWFCPDDPDNPTGCNESSLLGPCVETDRSVFDRIQAGRLPVRFGNNRNVAQGMQQRGTGAQFTNQFGGKKSCGCGGSCGGDCGCGGSSGGDCGCGCGGSCGGGNSDGYKENWKAGAYLPRPTYDTDKPFLMPVEDVFRLEYWDNDDKKEFMAGYRGALSDLANATW